MFRPVVTVVVAVVLLLAFEGNAKINNTETKFGSFSNNSTFDKVKLGSSPIPVVSKHEISNSKTNVSTMNHDPSKKMVPSNISGAKDSKTHETSKNVTSSKHETPKNVTSKHETSAKSDSDSKHPHHPSSDSRKQKPTSSKSHSATPVKPNKKTTTPTKVGKPKWGPGVERKMLHELKGLVPNVGQTLKQAFPALQKQRQFMKVYNASRYYRRKLMSCYDPTIGKETVNIYNANLRRICKKFFQNYVNDGNEYRPGMVKKFLNLLKNFHKQVFQCFQKSNGERRKSSVTYKIDFFTCGNY